MAAAITLAWAWPMGMVHGPGRGPPRTQPKGPLLAGLWES